VRTNDLTNGFPARDAVAGAGASAGRRPGLWSGLALVIACVAFASHVRLSQLSVWNSNPEQYVASGVPMMTTLDAYYSLRLARLYAAGQFVPHGPVPARHYSRPELGDPATLYDQREPKTLPLLSRAIADVSPLFGGDIDKTGLVLSPLFASLFMIPLFLCCWRLGIPAAGLMGGLVATFCITYYQRTGVGWVDTDSLNLFFPWMASCLILSMNGDQRRETLLLLSAATGIVLYVFFLWYAKPGLTLLYAGALAVHLRLAKVSWQRTILCVVTLAVFADVVQFGSAWINLEDFGHRYLWPSAAPMQNAPPAIRFPEVWSTIGEARHLHPAEVLGRILGRADMAAIGLAAFAAFAIVRWRSMPALAPLMLLGSLALISSQRFIFYLAPFAGIGMGLIVSFFTLRLLSWIGTQLKESAGAGKDPGSRRFLRPVRSALVRPEWQAATAYVAAIALFVVGFAPKVSSREFMPRPAIPAPIFRDLQRLAHRLPADSRIWTWWDIGFAIVDATGFGVYHDGAAQYTPQTNLIAASFISPDPEVMYDVIGFVDREGNRGIRRLAASAHDFDDLLARTRAQDRLPSDVPIYVLYTPDMLLKYRAIRTLGSPPQSVGGRRESPGIHWLNCERVVDETLRCDGKILDFRTGLIEGRSGQRDSNEPVKLRRAVMVEGGRVLRQQEYAGAAGFTVEIIVRGSAINAVYLLDEPAFESNLNQMFVLGRFDSARFEEAFNDFPYARVFRVRVPAAFAE
jgi:undecaprenyl-diphosphooligosaccharide--protein glycosyltransferase